MRRGGDAVQSGACRVAAQRCAHRPRWRPQGLQSPPGVEWSSASLTCLLPTDHALCAEPSAPYVTAPPQLLVEFEPPTDSAEANAKHVCQSSRDVPSCRRLPPQTA
jgi:hypothetical protein